MNLYVKPDQPVVSYLTPLTGLTAETLERHGTSLSLALATLRQALPRSAVLVGQSISTDVQWLGLQEGVDFVSLVDLAGLYRVWNTQYKSWSVFGQDHLARVLLGVDNAGCVSRQHCTLSSWRLALCPHASCSPVTACREAHNAVTDAQKSIRLFNLHARLSRDPEQLASAHQTLLANQPQPSFARLNPTFEGVCMGNKKTCACGGAMMFY